MTTLLPLIDAHYAALPQRLSSRLGASQIGNPCNRALFLSFRQASAPRRSGQLARICETGAWYETRIIGWLRAIGITVDAPDPQHTYTAADGHFVAKLDGGVLGVPGAEKTWHLLECKHANTKKYARIAKQGIGKAAPMWFAQCQIAMRLAGLERALVVVADKNESWETEDIYSERLHHDTDASKVLLQRAERLTHLADPPARIADTDEAHECRFCDHVAVCHHHALPRRCCRTCAFVEVGPAGSWLCTVAASMRGFVSGRPPEDYRDDVVACPEAGCCDHYLVAPCYDEGASLRTWVAANK